VTDVEIVQPIRDKRDIELMKKSLSGNLRNQLLFVVGINTALRVSDLLRLKVGDVRDKDVLTLREKKTGKIKRFRLNQSIRKAISQLSDAPDDEYLFRSREGVNRPISRQQAWNILNKAADRCGLNYEIGSHSLRKTWGFHAYESGVKLSVIQYALNHSSQRETLRYIGITQDTVDDVYEEVCL
jgi:integrase